MVLQALAVFGRLGALGSSLIVLGLYAKFITETSWLNEFLIYIEVVAAISVIGALVPPYPNFLYDSLWGAVWIVAAIFALVVQFAESNCYGLKPHSSVSCGMYKAATAFAFIALLAWLGSALLGGFRILALLMNVGDRYWGRPLFLGATKDDETVPRSKVRKDDGIGNSHIARWFICYGLLGVTLIAAGIPTLVVYGAPAFARYLMQGIPIPDNIRIELQNPTNDSIGVVIDSDVHVPSAADVMFHPMNVSFFFADESPSGNYTPIASLELPELRYGSNERLTVSEQRLKLRDLDAFARFIEAVAFSPSFAIGGRAEAKVKIASITTLVDLQKTVVFEGFNAFPTLTIPEIQLKTRDANGYNLHVKIVLNNPTLTSATLGNVTLDVLIGDIIIGEARVSVANIIPGENVFEVDAKLNVTNLQNNMEDLLAIEIPYLKNEEIIASASVKLVIYEGQRLTYWEEAFGRLEVTLTRPVRPLVQSVLDSGFLGSYMGPIVERVLDTILANVKEMDEDGLELYAGSLSDLARTALRLLSVMGLL
ncbi:hypothetical protein BJY04DRAFT_225038 [Aspergillus karnatakaensis]|uniref:uncharacterized protein n=1 Tax=Aspergillus karnatakaensis TaxID=1810916 RepID=UPI003CCD29F9